MSFRLFSSFLTAGNKSKCGTLQRLTDPQQSTVEPILRPVSSQNRQASQRKPFALSSVSAQTSSQLRKHRTSVPSRPQKLPGALIRTKSAPQEPPATPTAAPQALPQPHLRCAPAEPPDAPLPPHPHSPLTPATHPTCTSLPKFACNSRTGVTQWYKVTQTSKVFRGNCMRNCRTPHCAPEKSHVIPPGPHSPTAQKPRNTNDPISKPETSSRELRAKLLNTCHGSSSRSPPRGLLVQAAVPEGGGRARAGFETTHRATHQRPGAAGVEGSGGTGGHGRASRRGAERSEDA